MPDLSAGVVKSRTRRPVHGYYTDFPLVETLSEGGIWLPSNGIAGRTNMSVTTPGKVWSPANFLDGNTYDDGFSMLQSTGGPGLLPGRWPADQFFEFQVRSTNPLADPNFCEIEGQLRMTVTATQISGYEVNWRVNHDNTQYHEIVYWYGPTGLAASCADGCSFHAILHMVQADGLLGVFDGDILGGSIVGNRIRTWQIHNGVKQALADIRDTGGSDGGALFKTGNPGIGHWHHASSGAASDFWHTWYRAGRAAA